MQKPHKSPITFNNKQSFKLCAGKHCTKKGIFLLKIPLLDKHGYFCKECKDDLLRNELAILVENEVSIT